MLKSDLHKMADGLQLLVDELKVENRNLARERDDFGREFADIESALEYNNDQLKQISQSVYTMLQVKYPEAYNGDAVDDGSEDKRFLLFLHGLCQERSRNINSISDSARLFKNF